METTATVLVKPATGQNPPASWQHGLVDFVHTASTLRSLTAGELDEAIGERLCSLAAPSTPQPALAFLRDLLGAAEDGRAEVEGEADIRLPARDIALLGLAACEAVRNARRHAALPGRALRIWVRLVRDRDHLRLTVRDNGLGLPDLPPDPRSGRGLIAAVAARLGGYTRLGSAPFGGGLVSVVFARP